MKYWQAKISAGLSLKRSVHNSCHKNTLKAGIGGKLLEYYK
jgi:hypothetical protein